MPQTTTVTVDQRGDVAWVTIDNPPVNATSTDVRAGLERAVADVQGARVAVLRCSGRTFVAGGDLSEFDRPPEPPHLPDVVQQIETSPVPFVALLHGTVLGGGFELAMGCAWRIATLGTRFGLPEVNVGLIPGAGGTQRLPRLIGMEAAIDVCCGGKLLTADELLAQGGLDLIVDGDPEAVATAFVADLPARPKVISERTLPVFDEKMIEAKRKTIAGRARGQTSPLDNLDALLMATRPFADSQPLERAKHLHLRKSAQSRALRHAFFAERKVARPSALEFADPSEIDTAVVVGGGLMGAGITSAMLNAGFAVSLIEQDENAADAARDRVSDLVRSAVKRGKATEDQAAERLMRLRCTSGYDVAAGADLAIEAVFEDASVKQEVLGKLASIMGDEAILATNTSYLDPREIFADIPGPHRCLGLHFFSPAHVMKLLEVVRLPQTSADVIATAFALSKRLRKISVVSGICDGFIGNRMLAAYRREADYMLAGGALPFQIDDAMRAFGMPMGPYELQDLTGLQIAWANRKRQEATRKPAERYVTIADWLCALDRFGQRCGKGWYRYETGNRAALRDPEVETLIESYSAEQSISRRSFSNSEVSARLMAVLANEGARIVEEGVAESDAAVDVVQMHGYGFPRWRGGPMHYANEMGWEDTAQIMQKVAAESPNSWILSKRLAEYL